MEEKKQLKKVQESGELCEKTTSALLDKVCRRMLLT
jgi:hypothetical protein